MSHRREILSDRMVRRSLFRDRISNLTNLFRPEPNRTEPDRIFAFVNLLFGNCSIRYVKRKLFKCLHNLQSKHWSIQSLTDLAKMLCKVQLRNKKCSETEPEQRCSGPEQYQYPFRYYLYLLFVILYNWTFFARSYGWGTTSENR